MLIMARVHLLLVVALLWPSCSMLNGVVEAQLAENFYATSCPSAEQIIFSTMSQMTRSKAALPADLLRLFFHDCFVRGCDASVLLDGSGTEQSAPANFRLRGQNRAMNLLKQAVERACPNTVSCADILAFAARDGVVLSGGPSWTVKGGRRDGFISLESDADSNLPGPDSDLSDLTAAFASHNLTQADLVHLSGAHTIGESGCVQIDSRLYSGTPDPILTPSFLNELRRECPRPNQPLRTVNLDRQTPRKFDTKYYENLVARKGLLTSDQVLFEDVATKQLVMDNTVESVFFENFATSMVKLSELGVITGTEGEIRKRCFVVNTPVSL